MARKGMAIVDRVVQEEMGGGVDLKQDVWYIPTGQYKLNLFYFQ
jgi:hypothetical protein